MKNTVFNNNVTINKARVRAIRRKYADRHQPSVDVAWYRPHQHDRFVQIMAALALITLVAAAFFVNKLVRDWKELHSWANSGYEIVVTDEGLIAGEPVQVMDQLILAGPAVYTEDDLPLEPALNAVVYNSYLDGSEQDFVSVIKAKTGVVSTGQVEVEAGDVIYVHAYVRNASNFENAENVRISGFYVPELADGEWGEIGATLSADNIETSAIYSEVKVTAKGNVRLEYIPDSLFVASSGDINGAELSEKELFSDNGLLLGYDQQDGKLPGGVHCAVEVVYYLRVTAAADPDTVDDILQNKWQNSRGVLASL